jgi:hypothetical protein
LPWTLVDIRYLLNRKYGQPRISSYDLIRLRAYPWQPKAFVLVRWTQLEFLAVSFAWLHMHNLGWATAVSQRRVSRCDWCVIFPYSAR